MTVDVVIAGAGPNGLLLAGELALAGIRSIVLDRLPEPSTEPRANGLVGQVVKLLDRRGLHQRLSGSPRPPQPAPRYVFGALPLDLSRIADNPVHLLPVPQHRITEVLAERAVELGVDIRWGHELSGFSQDADTVRVEVHGPAGTERLTARYLVGADGGRSTTRKLAGIDFPGVTTDRLTSRTAHATVPADWVRPMTGALDVPGYGVIPPFMHHRNERGLFVFAPFPGRPTMVSTGEWDQPVSDDVPMTLDELRASVRQVLGVDVPLGAPDGDGPHLLRRISGGNTRLADRFRDGRVLLVGDAAHVHSAIGGPGLNLGLQDAVNLGWKLAAVLHGWCPPTLLDSYEAERRPVAERVIMHTRAQSALIAPGSEVTGLRELLTELLADPGNVSHLANLLAGSDIRYPAPADAHPLTGRFCPDLVLHTESGDTRLADHTRSARPLLLDTTADSAAANALSPWQHRIDLITAAPNADLPATALLLRPDNYVAWATDAARPDADTLATLRRTTETLFGRV